MLERLQCLLNHLIPAKGNPRDKQGWFHVDDMARGRLSDLFVPSSPAARAAARQDL
jgi:hypothetical protein